MQNEPPDATSFASNKRRSLFVTHPGIVPLLRQTYDPDHVYPQTIAEFVKFSTLGRYMTGHGFVVPPQHAYNETFCHRIAKDPRAEVLYHHCEYPSETESNILENWWATKLPINKGATPKIWLLAGPPNCHDLVWSKWLEHDCYMWPDNHWSEQLRSDKSWVTNRWYTNSVAMHTLLGIMNEELFATLIDELPDQNFPQYTEFARAVSEVRKVEDVTYYSVSVTHPNDYTVVALFQSEDESARTQIALDTQPEQVPDSTTTRVFYTGCRDNIEMFMRVSSPFEVAPEKSWLTYVIGPHREEPPVEQIVEQKVEGMLDEWVERGYWVPILEFQTENILNMCVLVDDKGNIQDRIIVKRWNFPDAYQPDSIRRYYPHMSPPQLVEEGLRRFQNDVHDEIQLHTSLSNAESDSIIRFRGFLRRGPASVHLEKRVMAFIEYAGRGDLSSVVKRYHDDNQYIPEPFLWVILHNLLRALSSVEKLGRAHLDVKPPNIFLVERHNEEHGYPGYFIPILGDFGSMNDLNERISNPGNGTAGYLTPEQLPRNGFEAAAGEEGPVPVKLHVYITGLLLWTIMRLRVTGLRHGSVVSKTAAMQESFPGEANQELRSSTSGYSVRLEKLVEKCLAIAPDMRPTLDDVLAEAELGLALLGKRMPGWELLEEDHLPKRLKVHTTPEFFAIGNTVAKGEENMEQWGEE